MTPEPLILCAFCQGVVTTFAASHTHEDIAALSLARWNGCCRYWLRRGIPDGWWT